MHPIFFLGQMNARYLLFGLRVGRGLRSAEVSSGQSAFLNQDYLPSKHDGIPIHPGKPVVGQNFLCENAVFVIVLTEDLLESFFRAFPVKTDAFENLIRLILIQETAQIQFLFFFSFTNLVAEN